MQNNNIYFFVGIIILQLELITDYKIYISNYKYSDVYFELLIRKINFLNFKVDNWTNKIINYRYVFNFFFFSIDSTDNNLVSSRLPASIVLPIIYRVVHQLV